MTVVQSSVFNLCGNFSHNRIQGVTGHNRSTICSCSSDVSPPEDPVVCSSSTNSEAHRSIKPCQAQQPNLHLSGSQHSAFLLRVPQSFTLLFSSPRTLTLITQTMLFSITKAAFATLALGVAVTSAAPTSERAVSKRAGSDVLGVLNGLVPGVQSGCNKLSASRAPYLRFFL